MKQIVLLMSVAILSSCSGATDQEQWSGAWGAASPDVLDALEKKGVQGCGEVYEKENTTARGDFAVACTRMPSGTIGWTGYEVFIPLGEVMGPDLTAVFTKFGGPPRALTKADAP